MEWTWDHRKAASNLVDHDVFFEVAAVALDDPFQLSEPDAHEDDDRWRTIAVVSGVILFIVHTIPDADGTGRIISARKATKGERRRYEQVRH